MAEGNLRMAFIDITLPERNGLELLQEARRLDPDTVVIMMTGADDDFIRSKALKLGAFDFVTKPFILKELEELLERVSQLD